MTPRKGETREEYLAREREKARHYYREHLDERRAFNRNRARANYVPHPRKKAEPEILAARRRYRDAHRIRPGHPGTYASLEEYRQEKRVQGWVRAAGREAQRELADEQRLIEREIAKMLAGIAKNRYRARKDWYRRYYREHRDEYLARALRDHEARLVRGVEGTPIAELIMTKRRLDQAIFRAYRPYRKGTSNGYEARDELDRDSGHPVRANP